MRNKFALPREATAIIFFVLIFLGVGLINPAFLSVENILLSLNSSVVYTIVAIGIAFVIITGEIDVSVGATLGMTAAVAGTLIRDGHPVSGIIAALVLGIVIGFINGFGVTVLKIPSIIMTLGINGVVRGLIYVYTDGKWIENIPLEFKAYSQVRFFDSFTWFYLGTILVMIALHLILVKSRKGRYFIAVGDNIGGATLLGIPVGGTKMTAFVLSAFFAALGGVVYVSRVGFITPIAGNGYEMKVIAACVLGGISLTGGVGSLVGASVGAAIMASISRVLVFMGFPSDYDNTITGILLIVIVVSDAFIQTRSAEKNRRIRLLAKIENGEHKSQGADGYAG
jgi:AI-2 transport system permease protein